MTIGSDILKTVFKNASFSSSNKDGTFDLLVEDGIIQKIEKQITISNDDNVVDLKGALLIPGLFDIHTHGGGGFDFNMATLEQMDDIMLFFFKNGVTSVLATLMTDDLETMYAQLEKIAVLAKKYPQIKGIHLEGPFLSPKYKGAMPQEYILNADLDLFKKFQEKARQLIKLITIAPETKNAIDFISEITKENVIVSLGHSEATYLETIKAIKAGAKSFTHSFNAMIPFDHHEPGISGALLSENNYCEMILDGKHLSPDTVMVLNHDKLVIVTDSIMAAGLKDGEYYLGKSEIIVKGGDARLKIGNARAGSTLTAINAIRNYASYVNIPLEEASKLMSINPATLLNMNHRFGSIEVGKDADFLVIIDNQIDMVFSKGLRLI